MKYPGTLLLDLNLPRRIGLEVLAELKAAPDLLTIPVRCRARRTCCGRVSSGGLAVVLASSADEPEFNALRAALDADDAIDAATFAGDVESSKPAPDLVQVALERVGVPAEEAVFTDDTVWDVLACRKAGVRGSAC